MRALGIDAGGSSTKLVLLDDDNETALADQPALNGLMSTDLIDRLVVQITSAHPDAVGLGIAGLRTMARIESVTDAIWARTGISPRIADDAHVALWGAYGAESGAIVIAGTGSAALGRAGICQSSVRLGGHGFLVGDEGSGYWIGRELVRRALRSATGVGPRTRAIEDLVLERLGPTPSDVEDRIYSAPTDRRQLAALARTADQSDDPEIAALFAEASDRLIELGSAILDKTNQPRIAMVGGIWNIQRVREPFERALDAKMPARTPAVGAALWALADQS